MGWGEVGRRVAGVQAAAFSSGEDAWALAKVLGTASEWGALGAEGATGATGWPVAEVSPDGSAESGWAEMGGQLTTTRVRMLR